MSTVQGSHIDQVIEQAKLLADAAKGIGVVITIDLESDAPLAMGNYRMVVHAWPARHQPLAVTKHPEAQPTDPVARWIFDAVKMNLDALHALCLEFGCSQRDTVVDWLRKRLTTPQPAGYCIRHADGLRWRTLDSMGIPDWTVNEAEALCFTRRHHADAFAGDDPDDVRIVPRTTRC